MKNSMDSTRDHSFTSENLFLIGILSLAFALRVWGISYGMPYSFIPDETFLINRSLAFGTGDLNPHFFEWPGSLLMYGLFILYGLYYVFGVIIGLFTSTDDFAISFISDPTHFYTIGRLFTVILSTITVYITYYTGKTYYNRATGLIGASFLGIVPIASGVSHFTLTDTPLVLFFTLSFIPIYQIVKTAKPKYYIISGLLVGLGMSIKYNAAALVVPLLTAHLLNVFKNHQSYVRIILHKNVLYIILSVILGFIAGCPFAILDYSTFYRDLAHQFSRIHSMGNINAEYPSPLLFYIKTGLIDGLGIGISITCLAGVAYAIYRRHQVDLLLLGSIAIYFIYLSTSKVAVDKYLLPIIPLFLILGASFLATIYQKDIAQFKYRRFLFILGMVLIVVGPLNDSVITDYTLTQKDTRSLAKKWIEDHIPPGTRIAIDAGRLNIAKLSPPINDIPENLYATYVTGGKDNKYINYETEILSRYHQLRLRALPQKNYPLTRIVISSDGKIDKDVSLENFREKGVEYVVVSSYAYQGYLSETYRKNHPEAAEHYRNFYKNLERYCILIKEFPSEPKKRQGPFIKIYKIPYFNSKQH
jgi:hypothetical protein